MKTVYGKNEFRWRTLCYDDVVYRYEDGGYVLM